MPDPIDEGFKPKVAVRLYDRARHTERWYQTRDMRYIPNGKTRLIVVGHTVGDLEVRVELDVPALLEVFQRWQQARDAEKTAAAK